MPLQWASPRRMAKAGEGLRKVALGDLFAIANDPEVCGDTWERPSRNEKVRGPKPLSATKEVLGAPCCFVTWAAASRTTYDPLMSPRIDEQQTVADALADKVEDRRLPGPPWAEALRELGAVDQAVYHAVAVTPTPRLDDAFRRLSKAANYSRLWLGIGAAIAALGGSRGRRVALEGVLSIGATSATVNLGIKPLAHRRRPDRADPAPVRGSRCPHAGVHVLPVRPLRVGFCFRLHGGAALSRCLQCRSGCSPAGWPIRGSTPACTTRGMWCSARSSEPEPRPWSRARATTNRPPWQGR